MASEGNFYSYSDVSKVMLRAANMSATSALENNIFYKPSQLSSVNEAPEGPNRDLLERFYFSSLN